MKINGVPLENAKLTIKLAKVKAIRVLWEAQRAHAAAALAKAHAALKSGQAAEKGVSQSVKRAAEPGAALTPRVVVSSIPPPGIALATFRRKIGTSEPD